MHTHFTFSTTTVLLPQRWQAWILDTFWKCLGGHTKIKKIVSSHSYIDSAITCSKLTIETLVQGVENVQS